MTAGVIEISIQYISPFLFFFLEHLSILLLANSMVNELASLDITAITLLSSRITIFSFFSDAIAASAKSK
jgi:hypothetical protein